MKMTMMMVEEGKEGGGGGVNETGSNVGEL